MSLGSFINGKIEKISAVFYFVTVSERLKVLLNGTLLLP